MDAGRHGLLLTSGGVLLPVVVVREYEQEPAVTLPQLMAVEIVSAKPKKWLNATSKVVHVSAFSNNVKCSNRD